MAADKLIVSGLGKFDGEYDFDLLDLIIVGSPGCFTIAEYRRIKQYAGIRRGEIVDAIDNDDAEFEVVLAAIILTRNGKRVDEALLETRDALTWEFGEREVAAGPPVEPAVTPDSQSGGSTSSEKSES